MSRKLTPPRLFATSLLAAAVFSTACGVEGDYDYDEGIPEIGQDLTALGTACTFATTGGIATVVLASGETALIARRAVDSAITVNGVACGTATATLLKRLNITGAAGNETVILDFQNGLFGAGTTATAGIAIDMAAGTDAVKIRGQKVADTITFGVDGINTAADTARDITVAGGETFVVSSGDAADILSANGGAGTGTVFTTAVTFFGGAANDTLTGGTGADTLNGGDGADTLAGGLGIDTLNGDAGNDTFNEGTLTNGADVFNGGADTDVVSYALRTAVITADIEATSGTADDDGEASEGDEIIDDVEGITGGTLGDTLTCPSTACTLIGGTGDDVLTGGAGNDTLSGGEGADTLTGGDGDDTLNGDAGDDSFDEGTADNGSDIFNGGAGVDTVDYSGRTAALTVTMDGVTGDDGLASEADNVKADVEGCTGGTGDDTITGNPLANVLDGGDGDDILNGAAGDDTFDEGAAANGADVFNGGAGTDTVDYSGRVAAIEVTMDGAAADDGLVDADGVTAGDQPEADEVEADCESVLAGSGDDTLTGNDSDNRISGGAGADTISGGLGNDTLEGGAAVDVINGDAGDDVIDGEAGADTIDGGAGDGDICFDGTTNCEL